MPKRLDLLLVVAAASLLVAISWDALTRRPQARPAVTAARPARPAPQEAPVPELVRLLPSSTAFLPQCPARDLRLSVGPAPVLTLRFAGSRCHVPPLHLRAVLRRDDGTIVYRGPALAHEELSGNYAGSGVSRARLLGGCPAGGLLATVTGSGLRASGAVRCS